MDTVQRFLFEHANIRGELAHTNETYATIINQRPYPPRIKTFLGEALIACLLMVGSIKFKGEIRLQFQGDDRFPLLLVQCDDAFNIRAVAKYIDGHSDADYEEAFLNGTMALMIDQYEKTNVYESIVPIISCQMSDNLTHYFAQSEQITTQVWLAIGESSAAGMLLQLMPGQDSQKREQFWEYAVHIGATLTNEELLTLDNETILYRLYHETELRLFPAKPVTFRCRCSTEKMQKILVMLGKEEINSLVEEQGHVEVSCDFCTKAYTFDPIDITLLFWEK